MRIAQIAPLAESVPPKGYGGTERVVAWLADELVARGEDVTLFATADSRTSARLVPCAPRGLRRAGLRNHIPQTLVMLHEVRRRADEFDVLHFHIDLFHFPLFHDVARQTVTTLHGRLDLAEIHPLYEAFPDMPLVSISDSQRLPMPPVDWRATIHHGLPVSDYPFRGDSRGGYLAFLGRIAPEKRPDRAIEIAVRAGLPLRIAAKVDPVDQEYFAAKIAPMLEHPLVEFVGEIGDAQKPDFLGDALALLMPIDWPEPFGLVMIEAMSAGTPVIAWRNGSVPEVIDEGVTGCIIDSIEEGVAAATRVREMSRHGVRARFEERFSASRMAAEYLEVYEALRAREPAPPWPRPVSLTA